MSFDRKTLLQAAFADPSDHPHFKRFNSMSSEIVEFDLFVHIHQKSWSLGAFSSPLEVRTPSSFSAKCTDSPAW